MIEIGEYIHLHNRNNLLKGRFLIVKEIPVEDSSHQWFYIEKVKDPSINAIVSKEYLQKMGE